jgi:hypothetical protein
MKEILMIKEKMGKDIIVKKFKKLQYSKSKTLSERHI